MIDSVPLRVRYAETDQMGRAYHAWYLVWFETGRNSLFRKLDMPYTSFEKRNLFLPVRRTEVIYSAPVRYDEEITVQTWIAAYTKARLVCGNRILTETEEEAARGEVELVLCNADGKPTTWPDESREVLEKYRCGGP